jgi:NADH-quinone oxidoreductase subunit C/D
MGAEINILDELKQRFGDTSVVAQATADGIPTAWITKEKLHPILHYLKIETGRPYRMLYDLGGIDERLREHRTDQPASDFTVFYHLVSLERNEDVRLKVALCGETSSMPTITNLWLNANWYERELWDMFGIQIEGHPHLKRILLPPTWKGHPLRKEHPARATEMEPFTLTPIEEMREEEALKFNPEEWGLKRSREDTDFMFLNLGPQHPGTHGVFRLVVQLDGEQVMDVVPDIGWHHRGQEKMGERQSWHTYIPYTDRVEYLSGVLNNLAYVLSVEQLAGIEVPDRVKVIRVMLCELFRIISHLVFYGTFAADLGALSPVFYMFTDRERAFEIIEAICGARMHPGWFRIGGVAQDLPKGWDKMIQTFLDYLPPRLDEYEKMVMQNRIVKARTRGIGQYTVNEAIEWGVTGPGLRACGMAWDLRKKRPYSGYEHFEYDVPVGGHGDAYDRLVVHVEEMRQSLRIIGQCLKNMPAGLYKSRHPFATPPLKEYTMHDIETLITHFLGVSWGPVIPPGEATVPIESSKGNYNYYLISDGNTMPYRNRIRSPSFTHLQMIPVMARGAMLSDLIAILGSIDFVLSDVDR